jgi:hypothetical protein
MLLRQSGQSDRVVILGVGTSTHNFRVDFNVRCAVIPRPRQFPISLWLVRNHQILRTQGDLLNPVTL